MTIAKQGTGQVDLDLEVYRLADECGVQEIEVEFAYRRSKRGEEGAAWTARVDTTSTRRGRTRVVAFGYGNTPRVAADEALKSVQTMVRCGDVTTPRGPRGVTSTVDLDARRERIIVALMGDLGYTREYAETVVTSPIA